MYNYPISNAVYEVSQLVTEWKEQNGTMGKKDDSIATSTETPAQSESTQKTVKNEFFFQNHQGNS